MEILDKARQMVEASGVDSDAKTQMLRLIGLSKDEVDKYILANKPQLELNEENNAVLTAVEAVRVGARDYLIKPFFSVEQVGALISQTLRFVAADRAAYETA